MKTKQEFVKRKVHNNTVEVRGRYFKSPEFIEDGKELMFVVFYTREEVRTPIYSYQPGDPDRKFLKWSARKLEKCSLGAEEA